jgi:hypothetical protein
MSVPFSVNAVYTSFADMDGIARVEENGLILEFQVKDNVFGILKTQPKEVRIPFANLAEVTARRGWFGSILVVRARTISALAEIPGHDGAEIRLRCRRRHRDAAQELASQAHMRMVTRDLQRIVAETDRAIYPPSAAPSAQPADLPRQPSQPTRTIQ